MIRDILISMRPRQWLKNLFVFAALIFSRQFIIWEKTLFSLLTFLIFCLLSGAVYIINDCADAEGDRKHRDKRHRPIASKRLARRPALAAAAALIIISVAGAFILNIHLGMVAGGYLILMTAYSLALKRIVIVDVLAVASGFILRVVAGGVVIDVPLSEWLLICTFLVSLFLALSKRRHELVLLETEASGHRPILGEYSATLLDQMIAVVTSSTVMAYSLYTLNPRTWREVSTGLYLSIPFVIYGIFRYLYLVHKKEGGGEPGTTLLSDWPILADILLWMIAILLILYFFPAAGGR